MKSSKMNPSSFYQPSTEVNSKGFALILPIIIILSLVLGFIYTMFIGFIPIIYANFLITMGTGFAILYLSKILFRVAHIRDRKSKIIAVVLFSICVTFFQWVAHIVQLSTGNYANFVVFLQAIPVFLNPLNFFGTIIELNKYGSWSLVGIDVKGILLAIIWLAEFAIILGVPLLHILKSPDYPYDENTRQWFPKLTLLDPFNSIYNGENFCKELEKGILPALEKEFGGGASRYSHVHIYYLPKAKQQYLSIENIIIEGQGTGKTRSEITVQNFTISTSDAKQILDKYLNKKEKIDII